MIASWVFSDSLITLNHECKISVRSQLTILLERKFPHICFVEGNMAKLSEYHP